MSKRDARERMLVTAQWLFARQGINLTTMEEVAREAPVSKRTLYAHFPTKDDLVLGQLQHLVASGETLLEVLTDPELSPRERLLGMFDPLPEGEGTARGCPFIDAAAEFPAPTSRVHAFARQQKLRMVELVREQTVLLGVTDPDALAEHLVALADGASSRAMVLNDRHYGLRVRAAAEMLIDLAPRNAAPITVDRCEHGIESARDHLGMKRAPGGLALVHDLLNTRPITRLGSPEFLIDPGAVQQWLARAGAGTDVATVVLDEQGVSCLRRFRDDLHRRIGAGEVGAEQVSAFPAVLHLEPNGGTRLVPDGVGWRRVASTVLAAVYEAQIADTWRRLKICRGPDCGISFYDLSRNNSRVWHDVRTCGNVTNTRAHRARLRVRPTT
jgi:AcrR family transcriptional regulator/predicted RNA-binding Zn ribbon-like protein